MTEECSGDQRLCPITRGDGIPFSFEFENDDETVKDIRGLKLIFTMKLDPASADGKTGDLQYSVIFPDTTDCENGKGVMLVPKELTANLSPNTDYFYDFKLIENSVPFTLGSGLVLVKLNVSKAIS